MPKDKILVTTSRKNCPSTFLYHSFNNFEDRKIKKVRNHDFFHCFGFQVLDIPKRCDIDGREEDSHMILMSDIQYWRGKILMIPSLLMTITILLSGWDTSSSTLKPNMNLTRGQPNRKSPEILGDWMGCIDIERNFALNNGKWTCDDRDMMPDTNCTFVCNDGYEMKENSTSLR